MKLRSGGPEPQPPSLPALAWEFLDRKAAGEHPDEEEYLDRLESDAGREEFRRLLESSGNGAGKAAGPHVAGEAPAAPSLGRYQLVGNLGAPGEGRVSHVWDPEAEEDRVVKQLPPFSVGDTQRSKRFLEECRLLARLEHPNLIRVHGAQSSLRQRYVVTDLIPGRTLAEVLEELKSEAGGPSLAALKQALGQPPEGKAECAQGAEVYDQAIARLFIPLLDGLELAHKQGLLHWNIKPENIMLRPGGAPVLLDFDLAGHDALLGGRADKDWSGAAEYLAPEQLKKTRAGPDRRTDVYQLGLLLFEMLTLRPALGGSSRRQVLARARRGRVRNPGKLRRGIPKVLERICARALKPQPDLRYARARDMRLDLERFLEGEPIGAKVPGRLDWGLYYLRVHRRRIVGALLFLGLAAAVIVLQPSLRSTAIELQPFVISQDGAEARPLAPGTRLQRGEIVGVEVDAGQPGFLYAVAVEGISPRHARFVRPLKPFLRKNFRGERSQAWGLPLVEGASAVCFQLVSGGSMPENSRFWSEGVWTFTAVRRCEWLEAWMARMEADGAASVPIEQALGWLQELLPEAPGAPLFGLDAEGYQALRTAVSRLDGTSTVAWPLEDPEWASFVYPMPVKP